ncbi:1605_t:CDS:2 [Diversispora eburnea]|uniref:1605_t:CDS:1 n=1 Tax=Diversispora eburnea TaxID=1213867 RepID=A0A9N8V5T7_9GLOM|nr:1605_t:CDS:2 [Diversispora eburnea]
MAKTRGRKHKEKKPQSPNNINNANNDTNNTEVKRGPGRKRKSNPPVPVPTEQPETINTAEMLSAANVLSTIQNNEGKEPQRGKRKFSTGNAGSTNSLLSSPGSLEASPSRRAPQPKRMRSHSASSNMDSSEDTPVRILLEFVNTLRPDPRQLSRAELLRAGTWLFDELLTKACSRPFINPVPDDAVLYRSVISHLMDLTTAENKLWAGQYRDLNSLYADIVQILSNAITFHREGKIYDEAKQMCDYFTQHLYPHLSNVVFGEGNKISFFDSMPLPSEENFKNGSFEKIQYSKSFKFSMHSPLFILTTVNNKNHQTAAIKKSLPSNVLDRLSYLNQGLTDHFNDGIYPTSPNLDESTSKREFVRVYVTKGVSTLSECIENPSAVAIVMGRMKFMRKERCLRFSALITKPFGKTHSLDTFEFSDLNDAKGWVKCAVLGRRDGIQLSMATHWFANKLLPYSMTSNMAESPPEIVTTPIVTVDQKTTPKSQIKVEESQPDHESNFIKTEKIEISTIKIENQDDMSFLINEATETSISESTNENENESTIGSIIENVQSLQSQKMQKRPRRSQRETYAYLNNLPKRKTRQQSQSEWVVPLTNTNESSTSSSRGDMITTPTTLPSTRVIPTEGFWQNLSNLFGWSPFSGERVENER